MPNPHKAALLGQLRERFGDIRKLPASQSLYVVGDDAAVIYVRYSKVHNRGRTFFGVRKVDLAQLEGRNSFICFLLDDGSPPLFIPYSDFEEVFHDASPADDGQYKAQLFTQGDELELYIARRGRFNVEGYVGLDFLAKGIDSVRLREFRSFSHSQIQTLLAGIGRLKGYDVWVPANNAQGLDWSLTAEFKLRPSIPEGYDAVARILCEIDVVWVEEGKKQFKGLFEVEHSTPVYTGLLRFNDVLLTDRRLTRFSIVSNDTRRALFSNQAFRPTFRKSGLTEMVSFLEYPNVYDWHSRLSGDRSNGTQSED